jgi:hypothetical protein
MCVYTTLYCYRLYLCELYWMQIIVSYLHFQYESLYDNFLRYSPSTYSHILSPLSRACLNISANVVFPAVTYSQSSCLMISNFVVILE